jgi:multisubunit Na+/H+ antiporter MnhB subunit
MSFKQLIPLSAAVIFFLAATYPKPVLVRVLRDAHPHELLARFCLVVLGLLALWGRYSIKA